MLTILYTYYDNPKMLACHMQEWGRYSALVKKNLQIIVVDDCSPKFPVKNEIEFPEGIRGRCFRVTKNILYNTFAARNIGFYNAQTEWILSLDIDHMMSSINLEQLFSVFPTLDNNKIYRFSRIEMSTGKEIGAHGGSILVTKELFWRMGGYDERCAGRYYGTSGVHHTRFCEFSEYVQLPMSLFFFDNNVVDDAINQEFDKSKNKEQDISYCKIIKKGKGKIITMSFPYEEVVL